MSIRRSVIRRDRRCTSEKPVVLDGLSIIIPAFNEEESLQAVVKASQDVASEISRQFEIIIVNDGSRDRTGEIADRLASQSKNVRAIHHPRNRGFGAAQKTGFDSARQEFVTLVPADQQFDVRCLKKFTTLIPECDVVVGYRINRKDKAHRKLNTKIFRMVMRLMFGINLRDINWVKLFRTKILDRMEITFDGIGVDAEIIVKAKRMGCRFREVHVSYLPRTTGQSTGDRPLRVLMTLMELFILWANITFSSRWWLSARKSDERKAKRSPLSAMHHYWFMHLRDAFI
ncbi:MAG: glycosyltransferase family 2 protein [Planctomycetes bacterium]|nr:glycosyltransferase family 2 protein [Planctomycetota bacterium]